MTVTILQGDCREVLRTLPDKSVQCCVTSPPYFGLRSYLPRDHPDKHLELGSEQSPDEYVAGLVGVFREVRRVLRDDGTLWLNLGDSFARDAREGQHKPGDAGKQKYVVEGGNGHAANGMTFPSHATTGSSDGFVSRGDRPGSRSCGDGIKPKDLLMIPAHVAIALRSDGWYLRSDCVWGKPNGLPESVTDRPTRSHEYVFLLSKSGSTLFWTHDDGRRVETKPTADYRWVHRETNERLLTAPYYSIAGEPNPDFRRVNLWSAHDYYYNHEAVRTAPKASTQTQLAKPYLGQSGKEYNGEAQNGRDLKARVVTKLRDKQRGHSRRHDGFNDRWDAMKREDQMAEGGNLRSVWWISPAQYPDAHFAVMANEVAEICIRAGSKPGDTILDPFAGVATTLMVADQLRRHAVGIELNSDSVALARTRIAKDAGMFADITTLPPPSQG